MTDKINKGRLPDSANLAFAYVPMQQSASPAYKVDEALSRGTMFPGLDLAFMDIVNKSMPQNKMTELMAIDFIIDELNLYLDTHKDDAEAFSMLQTFISLRNEAKARYTEKYGPLTVCDVKTEKKYTWVNDPWPWEKPGAGEG